MKVLVSRGPSASTFRAGCDRGETAKQRLSSEQHTRTTGAWPYNRPCAQQYVGKSQSCMVISGRLIVHAPVENHESMREPQRCCLSTHQPRNHQALAQVVVGPFPNCRDIGRHAALLVPHFIEIRRPLGGRNTIAAVAATIRVRVQLIGHL